MRELSFQLEKKFFQLNGTLQNKEQSTVKSIHIIQSLTSGWIKWITLIELFLVKADWGRTYWGEIRRDFDNNGNEIVFGLVIVNEGKIWSKASCQKELKKNMDDMCIMKLDMGLHSQPGAAILILENKVFLN